MFLLKLLSDNCFSQIVFSLQLQDCFDGGVYGWCWCTRPFFFGGSVWGWFLFLNLVFGNLEPSSACCLMRSPWLSSGEPTLRPTSLYFPIWSGDCWDVSSSTLGGLRCSVWPGQWMRWTCAQLELWRPELLAVTEKCRKTRQCRFLRWNTGKPRAPEGF